LFISQRLNLRILQFLFVELAGHRIPS